MFEILENQKEKMLDTAEKCFTTASKVSSRMNLCVMLAELSFRVLWLQLQIY
jgi:hypothetical protein